MSNYTSGVKNRRTRTIARLQAQLKSGKKPLESARLQKGPQVMQDLLPSDIVRIEKEIEILTSRIY